MRVGSLVELVDDDWNDVTLKKSWIKQLPVKEKVYTIREIRKARSDMNQVVIALDELFAGINPYYNIEEGFSIQRFRELQPPIANIEKHINENTLELQQI